MLFKFTKSSDAWRPNISIEYNGVLKCPLVSTFLLFSAQRDGDYSCLKSVVVKLASISDNLIILCTWPISIIFNRKT